MDTTIKTDSFFQQGVTHEVCEDYALRGEDYVVLADGCSNGGGPRIDSDWGARLLCKAGEEHLHIDNPNDMSGWILGTAQTQLKTLNLPIQCLTATLLTLQSNGRCLVSGDGIVGGKLRDGSWLIKTIEFSGGAPYYLKYRLIEQEQQEWARKFGGQCIIKTFEGDLMENMCPEEWSYDKREAFWEERFITETFDWAFDKPFKEFGLMPDKYSFTFIASDGPQSFYEMRRTTTQKYNERVHVMDALQILLDLRNFCPGFARLQRNWVFKQNRVGTFVRRNWHNGDDVSLGVIHYDGT